MDDTEKHRKKSFAIAILNLNNLYQKKEDRLSQREILTLAKEFEMFQSKERCPSCGDILKGCRCK